MDTTTTRLRHRPPAKEKLPLVVDCNDGSRRQRQRRGPGGIRATITLKSTAAADELQGQIQDDSNAIFSFAVDGELVLPIMRDATTTTATTSATSTVTSSVTSMGLNPLIRAGTPQQQRLPLQQKSATPQQQSSPPQQKSAAPGSIAPTAKTVTVNEQLAKELKHVQAVIAEAEWARNAPATKRLRDRIQNLVNAERALLTSLAPPHNLHNLQRYDDVFSITVQSP